MRQALRVNPRRQRVSQTASIPAPAQGWDATNPISQIKPENAVQLDNWTCRPGYVEVRKGYTEWSGEFADPVETLLVWRGPASEKMFAAVSTRIYDVTTETTILTTALGSLTNARWQYVNFSTAGGHFLITVNGADTPRKYDGSSWAVTTITGSGLTPADLIHVMAHKERLFFLEKDSLSFWYLGINAIAGAASEFPLGDILPKGGNLVTFGTWSVDGGQGQDDLAVFVSSEGEAAVYQGLDPGDATEWALVGVFDVGIPLGRRSLIKWGGDLALITSDGVVPLSTIILADRSQASRAALTGRIQNGFADLARRSLSSFGWQALAYPKGNLVIVNAPYQAGSAYWQLVMNSITGAWSRWKGINALCWAILNDEIYFGGLTHVCRADRGSADAGEPITADLTGAYLDYGSRGRWKQFKMMRPIFVTNRRVIPAIEMVTDFSTLDPIAEQTEVTSNENNWGVGLWGVALWGSDDEVVKDWISITGNGIVGAPRVRVVTQGGGARTAVDNEIKLYSFDLLYETGEVL